MFLWQGAGGLFIGPDTLVFNAYKDANPDELAASFPEVNVRRSTSEEEDRWNERIEAMDEAGAQRALERAERAERTELVKD